MLHLILNILAYLYLTFVGVALLTATYEYNKQVYPPKVNVTAAVFITVLYILSLCQILAN